MRQTSRALLLIVGVLLAWFTLREKAPAPGSSPVTASSSDLPHLSLSPTPTPPLAPPTLSPNAFITEFKKCFPNSETSPHSPDEWLLQAEQNGEIESRQLTLQNLHRRDSSGLERRMQIAPTETQAEIREFDVDEEGLPTPLATPLVIPLEQVNQVRDDFLRQGEKIYEQRKENLRFKNGLHGVVEWENQKTRDLQIFNGQRGFYCRSNECTCKGIR